jgi:TonB family protein
MKAQLLMLTAASLLFAGASAHAAPASALDQFVDRAHVQADSRLAAAGITPAAPVAVRATLGADGKLNGLRVTRSSGSRDTDYAVEQALKRMAVADAPAALIGANVTLTLGPAPIVQAKAR